VTAKFDARQSPPGRRALLVGQPAPGPAAARGPGGGLVIAGTVYLLHFDRPYVSANGKGTARHREPREFSFSEGRLQDRRP
jgi:hypothetical protein